MKSPKEENDLEPHRIPLPVSWYFGGATTGREIATNLLWRVGGIAVIVVSFLAFGMSGLGALMVLSVIGVWLYVWKKKRERT